MTFTIRDLLVITGAVAIHLGTRHLLRFPWLLLLPPLIALIAVAGLWRPGRSALLSSGLGAIAAAVSSIALTFEVSSALAQHGYWNWSLDWPLALKYNAAAVGAGAIIGASVGSILRVALRPPKSP
jgi:hypothetical protein